MAEEQRAGGQSVWLLLIALGLGLLVVVIYNFHIYSVRKAAEGQTVYLVRVARDMKVNDIIERKDLEAVPIRKKDAAKLGKVVREEQITAILDDPVLQSVRKGNWLLWDYLTPSSRTRPKNDVDEGKVAVAVPLDPERSLGTILRQNDRVNILGRVSVDGGPLKTYRILEGVRVLAIGGVGPEQGKPLTGVTKLGGMRIYRSLTIQVTPEVSLQLANVLTHVSGGCYVELRSSEEPEPEGDPKINAALQKMTARPSGPTAGGPPPGTITYD